MIAQHPKKKHDKVFLAALLNGRKIEISLQLLDPDLTWRVASTAHWTLICYPQSFFPFNCTHFLDLIVWVFYGNF